MEKKKVYKASAPRFSQFHGFEGVNILKKKYLFGVIPYWHVSSFIRNVGQVEEIIYLLNNPDEMDKRLKQAAQNIDNHKQTNDNTK